MASRWLARFAAFLRECRERAGLKYLAVQRESEPYRKKLGQEFSIHNTTLRQYEGGALPSPPKLLTLARVYKVPVGEFFRALGASDQEICSCSQQLPQNRDESRLVKSLLKVLREGDQAGVAAVKAALKAAAKLPKRGA